MGSNPVYLLKPSLLYENANSKQFCPPFNADSANLHITDRLKKQILIRKNLAPHELHFGMNTLSWPSFREEITSEKIFAKEWACAQKHDFRVIQFWGNYQSYVISTYTAIFL